MNALNTAGSEDSAFSDDLDDPEHPDPDHDLESDLDHAFGQLEVNSANAPENITCLGTAPNMFLIGNIISGKFSWSREFIANICRQYFKQMNKKNTPVKILRSKQIKNYYI